MHFLAKPLSQTLLHIQKLIIADLVFYLNESFEQEHL